MTPLRFSPPAFVLAGVLLAAAALPRPAAAQGIPVNDSTAILRLIDQYVRQGLMYDRQGLELDEALRQTASITGARALGTLHQTPELIQMRRRLPVLLFDLNRLAELATNPDIAQTLTLYGRLTDRYGLLEDTAYEPQAPDEPYALAWAADRDAQLAAATSAEVVYGNVDEREDLYDNMMTELDAREDLKESVDILARLTAENGRLLMELIRLQSAATQASAAAQLAQQTHDVRVRRMADYEDLAMDDWR